MSREEVLRVAELYGCTATPLWVKGVVLRYRITPAALRSDCDFRMEEIICPVELSELVTTCKRVTT